MSRICPSEILAEQEAETMIAHWNAINDRLNKSLRHRTAPPRFSQRYELEVNDSDSSMVSQRSCSMAVRRLVLSEDWHTAA